MTLGDLKTSVKHLSLGDCLLERWRLDENPSQEGFFFWRTPEQKPVIDPSISNE